MKASSPNDAAGGILADDMGLGKSLTMLTAIAASLPDAYRFVTTKTDGNLNKEMLPNARSTLIIVPSARKGSSQ